MPEEGNKYLTYDLPDGDLSHFVDVAHLLDYRWLFRGQADASWPISSALERQTQRLNQAIAVECEARILKQVKMAPSYPECRDLEGADDFSWLAFLQHHGCSTRLVDFTESFYVALYFAIRDLTRETERKSDGASAVWAISESALNHRMRQLYCEKFNLNKDPGSKVSNEEISHQLINGAIEKSYRYQVDTTPAVVCSRPKKLDSRMIVQQGLFLVPLKINESFEANLAPCLNLQSLGTPTACNYQDLQEAQYQAKVIQIRVPDSYNAVNHRTLLHHLKRMNISEATLFPDFDGYARGLNYYAALES